MLNMQNHKTTLVIMMAASVIRTLWFPLRPHSDLSANLSCSSLASCSLLTNAAASFPCLMQYLHHTCYRASNPNCSLTVVKLSVIMLRKYNNHTIIIIIISDNIEASFVLVLHGHVENKDSAVKNFSSLRFVSRCVQLSSPQCCFSAKDHCPVAWLLSDCRTFEHTALAVATRCWFLALNISSLASSIQTLLQTVKTSADGQ